MLSGIIVGGVGGSLLFYQDNIKYETQLNLLQSEIEEHQNTINNLNHVVETLNQDIESCLPGLRAMERHHWQKPWPPSWLCRFWSSDMNL